MNFGFSDEQQEIKSTAREFLAARFKPEKVRELAESESPYDEAIWDEVCELGWPGIAVSEEYGGQGLGALELVILQEELGYACAPTPLIANALAGLLIEQAGSDEQRQRWLPGIATGEQRGAAALTPDDEPIVGAAEGASVLVLNDGEGARLVEPAGASVERLELIDTTRFPARSRRRSTPASSRSPPSSSGSPSGRSTWRWTTRRSASSSAARSAHTRRCRTGSRGCCGTPRRPVR